MKINEYTRIDFSHKVLAGAHYIEAYMEAINSHLKFDEDDNIAGLSDDELTRRFCEAIRIDNEIKRIKGCPIAGYDVQSRRAYLEYPDGSRKYIEET